MAEATIYSVMESAPNFGKYFRGPKVKSDPVTVRWDDWAQGGSLALYGGYYGEYIKVTLVSKEAKSWRPATKAEIDAAIKEAHATELEHVAGIQHDIVEMSGDLIGILKSLTSNRAITKKILAMEAKYNKAFASSEICRTLAAHPKVTDVTVHDIYRKYVAPLVAYIEGVADAAAKGKTGAAHVKIHNATFMAELGTWTGTYMPRSDFGEVSGYLHYVPEAGVRFNHPIHKKNHHWDVDSLALIKTAFDTKIKAEKAKEAAA